MPLPNILDFIGNNVTQAGFKTALEKLLNYLNVEGATKAELAPKADKTYVDSLLASFQFGTNKFYPTLAAANADIANIMPKLSTDTVRDAINIGELANGGIWYKNSFNSSSLIKSPYDALSLAKVDASTKADAAKQAAIDAAAIDASTKADTAKSEALVAANKNTNNKINELKNASVISFDSTAYVNSGYISNNQTGAITVTTNGATRYTNLIEVKKDDVITINNAKVKDVVSVAFYDGAGNFINGGGLSNSTSPTILNTPFTVKATQDGFIRVFNLHETLPGNFTIDRPNAPLYGSVNLNTKKIISLNRFFNDEIFQESLKVGSSVFVVGRTANYFTAGTTVQDGYAWRASPVLAGDLVKVTARMDAGQILAYLERTDGIKTQIVKSGNGTGVLSEFLIEVPTDGNLVVNTFVDALNDHSITFYRKEKPYGLGEDRAVSYNDYMNNGRYDI